MRSPTVPRLPLLLASLLLAAGCGAPTLRVSGHVQRVERPGAGVYVLGPATPARPAPPPAQAGAPVRRAQVSVFPRVRGQLPELDLGLIVFTGPDGAFVAELSGDEPLSELRLEVESSAGRLAQTIPFQPPHPAGEPLQVLVVLGPALEDE